MSRHYSFFPSRVKARRERFASTRKSVSESWDQSFCDDEEKMPSFPDLPSPTIGAEENIPQRLSSFTTGPQGDPLIAARGDASSSSNPMSVPPPIPTITRETDTRLATAATSSSLGFQMPFGSPTPASSSSTAQTSTKRRDSSSGGEYECSPRSSADPAVPPSFWSKDVATQCALPVLTQAPAAQLPRHSMQHESESWVKWSLGECRRSKSFDWSYLPKWANKPWEPFHTFPLPAISYPSRSIIRESLLAPADQRSTAAAGLRMATDNILSTHLFEGGSVPQRRETITLKLPIPYPLSLANQGLIQMHLQLQNNKQGQTEDKEKEQSATRSSSRSQSLVCEHCLMNFQFTSHSQTEETQTESQEFDRNKSSNCSGCSRPEPTKASVGTNTAIYICHKHQQQPTVTPAPARATESRPVKLKAEASGPAETRKPQPSKPHAASGFVLPLPRVGTSSRSESPKSPPCSFFGSSKERQPAHHRGSKDSGVISTEHRDSKDSGQASADSRSKASTLPTIDSKQISAIRNAEKRRRFFARKQTNSAPDSFDYASIFNCAYNVINPTLWESEIRTARCGDVAVTHVSELDFPDNDPPCHFCCEQASTAIHDESRLQIVSGGLVRSRDGSARSGSAPYINLPSPNVQAEDGQAAFGSLDLSPSMSNTLSPGSHHGHLPPHLRHPHHDQSSGSFPSSSCDMKCPEEDPLVGPPASSLTRRPALVPPKLIPDQDFENDNDSTRNYSRSSDDSTSPRTRRSSIVVIPPMQVCPGDLLVYGKVLSQRKSLLGTTIESPSPVTSIFEAEQAQARKGKNTWSLMKLFERGNRTKGCTTGTLEDIMNLIQPCDFSDPKLTCFKGMCWNDFVSHVAKQKTRISASGKEAANLNSPDPKMEKMLTPSLLIRSSSPVVSATTAADTDTAAPTDGASSSAPQATITAAPAVHTSPALSPKAKKLEEKKEFSKPLMRKRMGLMRTMSDRCLERRITPALWRVNPGFLSEKLVEGKETGDGNSGESSSGGSGSTTEPTSKVEKKIDSVGSILASVASIAPLTSTSEDDGKAGNQGTPVCTNTVSPESSLRDEPRQKMRQKEALWDLFQSECSFLYDHLMVLKNVFMEPMKRIQVEGFAMYAEPELLFGNLDELCAVTYGFCKEFVHLLLKLTDAAGQLSTTEVLAKLFEPSSKARTMSQSYHRYALNYINALNYLETLRRHSEFCDFEKLCMRDPRCKKLQLTDLLVSPVQHIMKVPLILKDIQGRTNDPQEKELISQILEIQENSIRELDDKMRWLKNFERLLEIQRNIVWPSILEMEPKTWVPDFLRGALQRQPCDSLVVSPRRQIIHEGLLQLWDTGKPTETYVILFDDMLLITRRKKGLSKKKSSLTENWSTTCGKNSGVVGSGLETNHRYIVYRQPISLDRFFVHDIKEAENTIAKLDFSFVLVSLNRFQQIISVHTFQAPNDQIKGVWLIKMKSTQDKWKRTLQNTVFRGVRSSTDSGQSNMASSIVLGSLASQARVSLQGFPT